MLPSNYKEAGHPAKSPAPARVSRGVYLHWNPQCNTPAQSVQSHSVSLPTSKSR